MARGEWGYQGRSKWCLSYKKTTLIVCSINIVIALYVLCSIYGSIFVFSTNNFNFVKYTPDQIRKMEESIRIRRANEPIELIKLVKESKQEFSREYMVELPRAVKQRLTDEILRRLQSVNATENGDAEREAVERWRKEKLEEARQLSVGRHGINSSDLQEEARMLVRVLESDWDALSGEIGLWIPSEITQREHDKPEGAEEEELEEEILPGRPVPRECNAQLHTDYDGTAVTWGLTHHQESAADCCEACLEHAKSAKPGEMKCNIWVYCPAETGCYSPDIYEHKNQECWLKYAEKPRLNFKDKYSESYRNSHPAAPLYVPWVSGVITL
ncbi:uncharacterized protein LOC123228577 isoform X2 [Mangifera indica]|uniref:uncharacterized protein LOC123228577 isoform X2 n=2 Tax=Mangifera indica TaxID=29780 RepID=UPI001CFACEA9|nr:uncharacterized protein LOC123228577 isoform X2 [Mangifera indica]